MAVYEVQVRGDDKIRLVQAETVAQARGHVADAKAISADRLAELIQGGATIEKAILNPASDPASFAPGGSLSGEGDKDKT